jgi:hypothetical protein
VSDATVFDQATTMIEKVWAQPIKELETLAVQRPVQDPLLRSAMHIRSALVVSSNAVVVHQDRLYAMTGPGQVPAFYDLERITRSAVDLRVAQAESQARLQAIGHITDAREAAQPPDRAPEIRLAQAAVARSVQAPRAPDPPPGQPSASAAVGPAVATSGPAGNRSAPLLVAGVVPEAGVHRAGQLLHRHLHAPPVGNPALHHGDRLLLRCREAHRPLAVGDHRDVADRPQPPGGPDLALQPGPVPVSAALLRHVCSPSASYGRAPQPGYDNRPPRSIPGGRFSCIPVQFAHGRRAPSGKDYVHRHTACQRTGVGKNRRSTKGPSRCEPHRQQPARPLPPHRRATPLPGRRRLRGTGAQPAQRARLGARGHPGGNVHCTSPDGRVYVGWLPEDNSAWRRGIVWTVRATPVEADAAPWMQEFGPDVPSRAVTGFLEALTSDADR